MKANTTPTIRKRSKNCSSSISEILGKRSRSTSLSVFSNTERVKVIGPTSTKTEKQKRLTHRRPQATGLFSQKKRERRVKSHESLSIYTDAFCLAGHLLVPRAKGFKECR